MRLGRRCGHVLVVLKLHHNLVVEEAKLKEAMLEETMLKEVMLKEAMLEEAILEEAMLEEAMLEEAMLEEAIRNNEVDMVVIGFHHNIHYHYLPKHIEGLVNLVELEVLQEMNY